MLGTHSTGSGEGPTVATEHVWEDQTRAVSTTRSLQDSGHPFQGQCSTWLAGCHHLLPQGFVSLSASAPWGPELTCDIWVHKWHPNHSTGAESGV